MQVGELNKTMEEIWADSYIVPLYQRNFAWGYEQINQLIQDIYNSHKNPETNYYIGSLVVLQRPNGIYEIIDGQQRLTVLTIICRVLNVLKEPRLRYDSRPDVEKFFNRLFMPEWEDVVTKNKQEDTGKIARLLDAIDCVENSKILIDVGGEDYTTIKTMPKEDIDKLSEYIKKKVILVRTILPSDTDVAAYFEIMNNRGEQLQEHEIVKAQMMSDLKAERERYVFSLVWDACSQMNVPIQRSLAFLNEKKYSLFGENFDSLNIEELDKYKDDVTSTSMHSDMTIDTILENKENENINTQETINTIPEGIENKENENINTQETIRYLDDKYEAIVDFPNFLMYTFKAIMDSDENEVPLNSDMLLTTYGKYAKNKSPMEFIKNLLKCRVLFDRYVIKNQGDENEEENVKWTLQRPYCYKRLNYKSLRFRNTFSDENPKVDETDDAEEDKDIQKRVIKQQSMLQVTFRNRKYKNWLYSFLVWMKKYNINEINGLEVIRFLDTFMSTHYEELISKKEPTFDLFVAGTSTPHFLFNFIDYLYWVEYTSEEKHNISNIDYVEDFDFKYYNSVEHHYPQSYKEDKEVVDYIGNLCLISRRANSSLNDKAPIEKALKKDGLLPKRRIMYRITEEKKKWCKEQILQHQDDIEDLLSKYKAILRLEHNNQIT